MEILDEIRKIAMKRKEILAAGLFGSLARGNYNERSDIDVFVITERELSLEELENFFKRGIDNPEIDLAWAEYCYLKDRRESLLKDRERAFQLLSRG